MRECRPGRTPAAIGRFGAWILANTALRQWTYEDLAQKMHGNWNTVCTHVRHLKKPDFRTVVTYCYAFGMKDDPNDIWRLVEEDWA